MSYREILSIIGVVPSSSPKLFESFVESLLRQRLDDRESIITVSDRGGGDFILHDGIDELLGPVVVEAKFNGVYSKRTIQKIVRDTIVPDGGSLLIVVSGKPNPSAKKMVADLVRKGNFAVWDYEKLRSMVSELGGWAAKDEAPRLNSLKLREIIPVARGSADEWKHRRDQHINALGDAIGNKRVVPIVGAGLSVGAGLMSWAGLLNSLAARVLADQADISGSDLDAIVQRFVEVGGTNPLILARYLQEALGDDFVTRVSETLYSKDAGAVDFSSSEAYRQLARLCRGRRTGSPIKAIISYNYDDVLLKEFEALEIDARPMLEGDIEYDQEDLPVFFVHGFLPRDNEWSAGVSGQAAPGVVLSEEQYHALYRDPYHWSNIVQVKHMIDHTCLFLGHSMTDPNLRRLLEIAAKYSRRIDSAEEERTCASHYAVLRRLSVQEFCESEVLVGGEGDLLKKEWRQTVQAAESSIRAFLTTHHDAEERLYRGLGVNIIWIEGWDEIPEILRKIQQ